MTTTALPTDRPLATRERDVEPDAASMKAQILAKLIYAVGKDPGSRSQRDWFMATALAVRDRIVDRWIDVDAADLPRRAASASTTSRSSS